MKRWVRGSACALLWVALSSAPGAAEDFLSEARAAVAAGDSARALALLEEGLGQSPDRGQGWLLAGKIRAGRGDCDGALEAFRRAEETLPLLGDCAALFLGETAADCGRGPDAIAAFERALAAYPGSRYVWRTRLGLGRAAFEAGIWRTARTALAPFKGEASPEEGRVEALWLLARAAMAEADWAAAQPVLHTLWMEYPAAAMAKAAGDTLAFLERERGLTPIPVTAEDRLERADRLSRAGESRRALEELREVVLRLPESGVVPEALYREASILYRTGRNREAIDILQNVLGAYPGFGHAADAHYLLARVYWRLGYRHQFTETCEEVLKTYPGTEAAENAELALGVHYGERGLLDRAREVFRRIGETPGHSRRGDALWDLGRLEYRDGRFEAAHESFAALAADASSGWWKAAVYWTGRTLERMGRTDDARAQFSLLAARCPGHYYGIESLRRLGAGALPPRPPRTGSPADFALPSGWGGNDYLRVRLLEEAGLPDFALDEMEDLLPDAPPGARLEAALLAGRAGRPKRAADLVEATWRDLIEARDEGAPRALWELAFPKVHWDEVLADAKEFGVDPFLVAAVIREESRYDERAVSGAGARGLLQLMPGTAEEEARRLGMPSRNLDLFDPGTNLRLGTASLAKRIEGFGGNRILALAGYNAGDHRAKAWEKEYPGLETDEFIDQIPYLETRLYVKRILASYEYYRWIYGAPAAPGGPAEGN